MCRSTLLQMLPVILLFLLNEPVRSCSLLNGEANVENMQPFQRGYDDGETATITCTDSYIISWATDTTDTDGVLICTESAWKKQGDLDYSGTMGCVACVSVTVDCTDGTCSADGECDCALNFKKSQDNPRLCEEKTCPLTLSNAAADSEGPYTSNTVVTVRCTHGYHVKGTEGVTEQVLTCSSEESFTPIAKDCIVCSDNTDCTDGTCNGNGLCECDETSGYKLAEGSLSVCELVSCKEDYCRNNGVCSKKGIVLECDCPTGTTGDNCEEFTSDPCSSKPCKNSGSCSRDMSDQEDVTNFLCGCSDQYEGDNCEYAKVFHISNSKAGARIQDLNVKSAEFQVKMAAGASDMYIALIKGKDNSENDIKIVLRKLDDETLELSVTKQTEPYQTTTEHATGLALASGAVTKLKLYIDVDGGSTKIKLDVDDVLKATSAQVADLFSEFWFGGSPVDCRWDETSCPAGVSRTLYTPFVGTLHGVVLGAEKQQFDVIGVNAVATSMGCSEYSCANHGTCSNTAGYISCACPNGYRGLDCDKYTGLSFNGYTSSFKSNSNLRTIPLNNDEQTLTIDVEKSVQEVGEIVRLNLGTECDLRLSAAGGTEYTIEDKQVSVEGSRITVTFDGTNAVIGGVTVPCTWDFSSPSSTITYELGGSATTEARLRTTSKRSSEQKLSDRRYQGCVRALSINGVNLLLLGDSNTLHNLVTDQCVSNLLPADPCEALPSPCNAGWSCSPNPDDYSAVCKYTCSGTGHACTSKGECSEFGSVAECTAELGADKCATRWYYQCVCSEGWEGINCQTETAGKSTDTTTSDSNVMNNTTIIILIAALLVVIVLGVVIIIIVKKQKVSPINVIIGNGKGNGWFSPEPLDELDVETPRPKNKDRVIPNTSADHVIPNMSADHVISNISAGQRAVKLNYSTPHT